MKSLILLLITGIILITYSISEYSKNNEEQVYISLYVVNLSGNKEKIADFYQKTYGIEDCELLAESWKTRYSTSCEIVNPEIK